MMNTDFILTTDRLLLRPAVMDDAPALQAVTDDPAILDMVNFLPRSFPLDEAVKLIETQDAHNRFLAICDQQNGTLIGLMGLHWHDGQAIETGYWLGKDWHGKGLATECLSAITAWISQQFPDWSLMAECRPENLSSMKLLTKCGFRETGRDGKRPGRKVMEFRAQATGLQDSSGNVAGSR